MGIKIEAKCNKFFIDKNGVEQIQFIDKFAQFFNVRKEYTSVLPKLGSECILTVTAKPYTNKDGDPDAFLAYNCVLDKLI